MVKSTTARNQTKRKAPTTTVRCQKKRKAPTTTVRRQKKRKATVTTEPTTIRKATVTAEPTTIRKAPATTATPTTQIRNPFWFASWGSRKLLSWASLLFNAKDENEQLWRKVMDELLTKGRSVLLKTNK